MRQQAFYHEGTNFTAKAAAKEYMVAILSILSIKAWLKKERKQQNKITVMGREVLQLQL